MTRYGIGKKPIDFSPSDREIFLGVLKTIADEFTALVNMRNNLLHGTWFVGYTESSSDPFAEEFHVHKYAVTKEGLAALKLPKSRGELLELGKRCTDVTHWLWQIDQCINGYNPISERFQRRGSDWVIAFGQTTLPKK